MVAGRPPWPPAFTVSPSTVPIRPAAVIFSARYAVVFTTAPKRSARASLSVCVTAASGSCIVHATLVLLYICCFLFVAVNFTSVGIRKRPSRPGLHTANSSSIDRFCTRRRLCLKCPACAIAVETVLFYNVLLLFVKNIRSRTRVYSLHRCVMCFPEFACPCGW